MGRGGKEVILRKQGSGLEWVLSESGGMLWLDIEITLVSRERSLEQGQNSTWEGSSSHAF